MCEYNIEKKILNRNLLAVDDALDSESLGSLDSGSSEDSLYLQSLYKEDGTYIDPDSFEEFWGDDYLDSETIVQESTAGRLDPMDIDSTSEDLQVIYDEAKSQYRFSDFEEYPGFGFFQEVDGDLIWVETKYPPSLTKEKGILADPKENQYIMRETKWAATKWDDEGRVLKKKRIY